MLASLLCVVPLDSLCFSLIPDLFIRDLFKANLLGVKIPTYHPMATKMCPNLPKVVQCKHHQFPLL